MIRTCVRTLLARFSLHHWGKFGSVPFAGLHMQSLAMKWNAKFMEGGINAGTILIHLWTTVHDIMTSM